jgi:xanthine dehydrogenase accessory factor
MLRRPEVVVVRGGGEMASAAARLLFLSGFPVTVLEREAPLAVRRRVAFAEAVFAGEVVVEAVLGRRVPASRAACSDTHFIPVVVDPEGSCIEALRPAVVVDGRMAKRNLGTRRTDAAVVVGLGPGFVAGMDVLAVVETQRGPELGRVYWQGGAQADTGIPAPVAGKTRERVLWAPKAGAFQSASAIGALVEPGDVVGTVNGAPVVSQIAGILRGLVADGVNVAEGMKLGDVDPRGRAVDPSSLSDKGRAVAAGVLEAVLLGLQWPSC